mgnify:CR=1 FL=1|tara:strand:+ start:606 stop:785 length:180 start_codon:yes stop_codon:yes gene_type:complete
MTALKKKSETCEEQPNKTIKVYVQDGCVRDVTGLPEDYDYEIIDYDVQEEDEKNDLASS